MKRLLAFLFLALMAPALATDTRGDTTGAPPIPGSMNVYWGCFANNQTLPHAATLAQKAADLTSTETTFGRACAADLDYLGFNQLNAYYIANDAIFQHAIANRSVPELKIQNNYPLDDITNGLHDQEIIGQALALRAVNKPIFYLFMYEMNLSFNASSPSNNNYPYSFNQSYTEAQKCTQYANATEHIHTIFQQKGATNVAFVWDPNLNATQAADTNLHLCLPPSSSWVFIDAYDKLDVGFKGTIQPAYNAYDFGTSWNPNNLPLGVGETGECNSVDASPSCTGHTNTQSQYYQDMVTYTQDGTTFPHMHHIGNFWNYPAAFNWRILDDTNGTTQATNTANNAAFNIFAY